METSVLFSSFNDLIYCLNCFHKASSQSNDLCLDITNSFMDLSGKVGKKGKEGMKYRGTWNNLIPRWAILRFTQIHMKVLSNFLGRGTDLLECVPLQRLFTGIDISSDSIKIALKNATFENLDPHFYSIKVADARNEPFCFFDLILSHPPYFKCISYSKNRKDLSRASNFEEFISSIQMVASHSFSHLRMNGHLLLGIGDNRKNCSVIAVGFEVILKYLLAGLSIKLLVALFTHFLVYKEAI